MNPKAGKSRQRELQQLFLSSSSFSLQCRSRSPPSPWCLPVGGRSWALMALRSPGVRASASPVLHQLYLDSCFLRQRSSWKRLPVPSESPELQVAALLPSAFRKWTWTMRDLTGVSIRYESQDKTSALPSVTPSDSLFLVRISVWFSWIQERYIILTLFSCVGTVAQGVGTWEPEGHRSLTNILFSAKIPLAFCQRGSWILAPGLAYKNMSSLHSSIVIEPWEPPIWYG